MIVLFALLGGWVSRMCGGAPPKLPWGLDQWIYAVPYLTLCLLNVGVVPSVVAYCLTVIAKRTGHGTAMDLGTQDEKETSPEKLEFLWSWMPKGYWHDFVGLAVLGAVVALPAAVLLAFSNIWCSGLLIAGGAAKALSYAAGWKIYPKPSTTGIPHIKEATAVGEFLTGVFGWGSVALCVMMTL